MNVVEERLKEQLAQCKDADDYRRLTCDEIQYEVFRWLEWVDEPKYAGDKDLYEYRMLEAYQEFIHLVSGLLWVIHGGNPMRDMYASFTGVSHDMTYGVIAHSHHDGLKSWGTHT